MPTDTCTNCLVPVDTQSCFQCVLCDRWTHNECANITDGLFKSLVNRAKNLNFICDLCLPKVNAIRQLASIPPLIPPTVVKKCKPLVEKIAVKKIKQTKRTAESAERTPIRQTRSRTTAQKSESISTTGREAIGLSGANTSELSHPLPSGDQVTGITQDTLASCDSELNVNDLPRDDSQWSTMQRKTKIVDRSRCLLLVKAPESMDPHPENRIMHDRDLLKKYISKMFDSDEDGLFVEMAYRLGKRSDQPELNPRPLRVVLESSDACERVFKRTYRLRGESVFVLRDLCPEDRVKMKQAVEELKRRKDQGESNLTIVDFRVVPKRPIIRWRPGIILPTDP